VRIFARYALAEALGAAAPSGMPPSSAVPSGTAPCSTPPLGAAPAAGALLLEGSWPDHYPPQHFHALDDAIDARYAWIDASAIELAARLAGGAAQPLPTLAFVHELKLRYFLVKLLRVVAYFEAHAVSRTVPWELVVDPSRDGPYVSLLQRLAEARGVPLRLHSLSMPPQRDARSGTSDNLASGQQASHRRAPGLWRRWAASWLGSDTFGGDTSRVRYVLCGNRRWLDPVCREVRRRRAAATWLYDVLAVRALVRWRPQGVGQFVCRTAGRAAPVHWPLRAPLPRLEHCGIDLLPAVDTWLQQRAHADPYLAARLQRLDRLFSCGGPTVLVLDEDATPLARLAVYAARRYGIRSLVVQHGVPRVAFGFAPLLADAFCAWGPTSAAMLHAWGVGPSQMHITGVPRNYRPVARRPSRRCVTRPPRLLLFATVLPRDDRPDAVAFHLTRRTYTELIRMALRAAEAVGGQLFIKRHPRCQSADFYYRLLREFPSVAARLVSGAVDRLARSVDCVLNCASSAGNEAAACGAAVIELLPRGCCGLPSSGGTAAAWRTLGTASSLEELLPLLRQALDAAYHAATNEAVPPAPGGDSASRLDRAAPLPDRRVLAWTGSAAAARIVDVAESLLCRAPQHRAA
jgi:hypothetical protein